MFGGADAPMPEDEPQFGSLWEHIVAGGKSRSQLRGGPGDRRRCGDRRLRSRRPTPAAQRPASEAHFDSTDRRYPTFNLGIPDQYRVAEFERDFRRHQGGDGAAI